MDRLSVGQGPSEMSGHDETVLGDRVLTGAQMPEFSWHGNDAVAVADVTKAGDSSDRFVGLNVAELAQAVAMCAAQFDSDCGAIAAVGLADLVGLPTDRAPGDDAAEAQVAE